MKKLLLLFCALLCGVGGAWADVLPNAVVGTTAFQATALTTGASGHTITKDGSGNVTISPNNSGYFGNNSGAFTGTLVIKINVPETPTAGVLFEFRSASNVTSDGSQGLYMSAERVLATSWTGSVRGDGNITLLNNTSTRTLASGEHTIIYVAGENGAFVVADATSTIYFKDANLKRSGIEYKVIYIPAAYAQYITEVHYFSDSKSDSDKTIIFSECSNHMHASQQAGTTASVASGKTLILDKAVNWTSLTGTGTVLQEVNINTTVAGNLPALTLKATAGTLTYTGSNLNGTTLDGVILEGTTRIITSNIVTIKDLAGNNLYDLPEGEYNYVFVGSGTLNFYGTCDLTKKSNGADNANCKLGYGKSASINIKEGANVTTGAIFNTTTSDNNAMISIESGATLSATAEVRSKSAINQGTMIGTSLYGPISLSNGSTTTFSNATPINDNNDAGTGAITVNGDATLNLTATTATLNKAITVAADKTLTIDCKSNAVNLNVVPTLGSGSNVNVKNFTIDYAIRDLPEWTGYTFTSCTAKFIETTDEYKAGGFTITNIPAGVTVKVKKYGTTEYTTETPVDGTITISHSVEVSGSAAWLDYTFNLSTIEDNTHSPADRVIDNAGNAGTTGQNLTIDTGYNTDNSYNEDGTLKVMSTPYRGITWPTNYTVAVAGNVPDVENGCLVAFGSTTNGSKNYLAIIRGANQNEIKLVKGNGFNAYQVISTMTAANATALSHLVVFTKNGNTFTVYLDGIQKTQVEYSETLGTGFQIGSIHGGVSSGGNNTGIERVSSMSDAIKEKVFAKAIRVYDYVISGDQMDALTTEFPYTSFGGKYSRTITTNSNLSATNAWLNEGTQGNVDVPVNAIVEAVTYYPDVEITTTTASTLTVNANMDAENIKFDGAGKLTIASDGEHNIHIYGSLTANGPISVKYGETDLSAVPVTIGESGSVEFDFSDYVFSVVNAPTDYPVTGNTADYGSKVTGVYPSDDYHTYSLAFNGTTNRYVLTVGPTVALKQQQAIALVTPYYNGNHVGAGLGKYTISLGETSYAEMADFRTAVTAWETLGDCVEPTIVFNMPTTGFYRFTSQNNLAQTGNVGKYLHNYLTSGALALNTTEDKTTIFYVDRTNNKLLSYDNGLYLNNFNVEPAVGSSSTWTIEEGSELGKYALKWADGWYASDWNTTDNITYGQKDANALWAIEPVESLPVTITAAKYATLYSPVALTIQTGVKAYYISDLTSTEATLTEISTTIPAETPVILYADVDEATTYNFAITTADEFDATNKLAGQIATFSVSAEDVEDKVYYTLQKNAAGTAVGLFPKTAAGTIAGFKAYLPASEIPSGALAKGFTFKFEDVDGISTVQGSGLMVNGSEIFNLAGQRMSRVQKGVNIVNGKKVLVK